MIRGEGPDDTVQGQSGLNVPVVRDIPVIVIIHKIMVVRLPINGECREEEKYADPYLAISIEMGFTPVLSGGRMFLLHYPASLEDLLIVKVWFKNKVT